MSAAALSREEAIEGLARELHWKMEHLDPTDGADWELLSDSEREFYRQSVAWMLLFPELIEAALRPLRHDRGAS